MRKKLILVFILGSLLAGCSALGAIKDKFDNCDAACEAGAQRDADTARKIISMGYPIAAGAGGMFVYVLSRAIRGKKKEEPK